MIILLYSLCFHQPQPPSANDGIAPVSLTKSCGGLQKSAYLLLIFANHTLLFPALLSILTAFLLLHVLENTQLTQLRLFAAFDSILLYDNSALRGMECKTENMGVANPDIAGVGVSMPPKYSRHVLTSLRSLWRLLY